MNGSKEAETRMGKVPEWRSVRRDWLMHSMGYSEESVKRPYVAVVNSWSEMNPGHYHLRELAQAVKRGILMAGGTPLEFNTASICDGFVVEKRLVLPFRDLISFSIEMMLKANSLKGAVFLTTCDKNVPAHLMAAARVNLPSIFVTGGPMLPGRYQGRDVVCCTDGRPMIGKYMAGEVTEEEFREFSLTSHGSIGACGMMGTANTMQCLAEAMGMSLTGCASVHAVSPAKYRMAEESGRKIMDLIAKDIKPSDIMTKQALSNAVRILMAIGGSTNGILHLLAISHEAGRPLGLDAFEKLSHETPFLCDVKPSGKYTLRDFDEAGGVPVLMKHLADVLDMDVMTVTGKSLGENLKGIKPTESDVIRSRKNALRQDGGIIIIKGNLAPEGAVIKQTAFPESRRQHTGRARVFNSIQFVERALNDGSLILNDEEVLVLKNQGPRGAPGMPETHIPPVFYARGLSNMLIITDGRTSGSTTGPMVLHIAPEAAAGGPLAVVEEGDTIKIDVENRRLDVLLTDEEIKRRQKLLQPRDFEKDPFVTGWIKQYAESVGSSSQGAIIV
ncbi:MAG: dihydroxy-acid dehydratase [Desulfobacteraceae bacterium]|nr:dihydroxy-acid dehydratase [Desulfobacteraceae bacterium]